MPDASLRSGNGCCHRLQPRWAEQAFATQPAAGTEKRLQVLHEDDQGLTKAPFSFVYGGKPSAELLPQWNGVVQDEQPDAATRRRTLTFTDPQTALEVQAVASIYLDVPGVDWTLRFTNRGEAETPYSNKCGPWTRPSRWE